MDLDFPCPLSTKPVVVTAMKVVFPLFFGPKSKILIWGIYLLDLFLFILHSAIYRSWF
jgi:hypothetical protein